MLPVTSLLCNGYDPLPCCGYYEIFLKALISITKSIQSTSLIAWKGQYFNTDFWLYFIINFSSALVATVNLVRLLSKLSNLKWHSQSLLSMSLQPPKRKWSRSLLSKQKLLTTFSTRLFDSRKLDMTRCNCRLGLNS